MMRVSSQQVFRQAIGDISDLNAQTQRVQQQIANNERLLTAADDPVAATRILKIEAQLSISDQYLKNIDLAENRLQLIEGALDSIETIMFRIQELVISADGPGLVNNNRTAISLELQERLEELEDLVNTRDANGDYIFSGFRSDAPAYEQTISGYQYRGDDGVRQLQISNSAYVAISESGFDLFGDIPVVNNRAEGITINAADTNIGISGIEVTDQSLYDADFPADYIIEFGNINTVAPPGPNYTITRRSDGAELVSNAVFDPVNGIDFNGLNIAFNGTPSQGDQFLLEATNKRDLLSSVQHLVESVANIGDSTEFDTFVADSIDNIKFIQDSLAQGRSRIGARLNTIDSTRNTLESANISNQEILSEIRDLDYAEAVSNLSFVSFVLEAAQQSFVRVSSLSLFNFLR